MSVFSHFEIELGADSLTGRGDLFEGAKDVRARLGCTLGLFDAFSIQLPIEKKSSFLRIFFPPALFSRNE